ncbi:MAG: hypothetical protein H7Y88_00385 [Phycisphaerales bacterium]|nr:hypothetical protein [Phycisphaerales bacterium]
MAKAKRASRARQASEVMMTLPERPLAYSDAIFVIRVKGEKLGELRISQGSLDWYARNAKRPKRITWARLAGILDDA